MAATTPATAKVVHRTARVRLRLTRLQAQRCYRLLRAAGDVWAWLLDSNRSRLGEGGQPVANYQALCRELAQLDSFGELSTVGARSVLRRYSDAWFQAAKRRNQQQVANFPRRKRSLIPVCYHHGTLQIRALRAESYLHLGDQRARSAKAAGRAPKPGQYGSRRWRRHRIPARRAEARHRRPFTRPSTRPPSRWSPLQYSTRSAPC